MIEFTEKQKKKQDKQLREAFDYLNERFFDNDISPNTIVRFAKCFNPREKEPGDAHYLAKTETIEIDELYRGRFRAIDILLLHEMAHAKLFQHGFVGWKYHSGHGLTFHGEISRLIKIGAYDALL